MHKLPLVAFACTFLIMGTVFSTIVLADAEVGVKMGDWIQYQVIVTGNPPPEYNITWARMDITGVQGEVINVSVQTLFGNGTLYPEPDVELNVATGAIGDGFFIPTNLNPGDQYQTEYEGTINITNLQQLNVGGSTRTVLEGTTNQTTYYWDKQTGIMVAATSNLPTCTLHTKTSSTNIWQPQILPKPNTILHANNNNHRRTRSLLNHSSDPDLAPKKKKIK